MDVTTEEQNVPNINWGLEKNNIDEKLKTMQEQIEQRLASQFTKMVDEKVSDQLKGVSTQIKTIVNRLDHLENKVVSIEKVQENNTRNI